jgi:hypothetical protein
MYHGYLDPNMDQQERSFLPTHLSSTLGFTGPAVLGKPVIFSLLRPFSPTLSKVSFSINHPSALTKPPVQHQLLSKNDET